MVALLIRWRKQSTEATKQTKTGCGNGFSGQADARPSLGICSIIPELYRERFI